jgi:RNA cyclic group end recognition protein
MIPIHELLNRIRWDSEFARGSFQLGYYDRAEDRIILVPLQEITFPEDSPKRLMSDAKAGLQVSPANAGGMDSLLGAWCVTTTTFRPLCTNA